MNKRFFIFSFLLILPLSFGQEAATSSAKPKNPRAGRVLKIRESLRISDDQGGFFFKSPENIQPAPDGGVFVLDEGEFLRFDAKGNFIKNIFRPGQGPGEFQRIENYLVLGTEILAFQTNPMKFVRMDLGGNLLRDFKPDIPVSRLLGRLGDRLLTAHNSFPAVDKVKKPEGEVLDISWTLQIMTGDGPVEPTTLSFPTQWFAKRLPGALIANDLTSLLWVPLEDGLIAVAHEAKYIIKIADVEKKEVVRTILRQYGRVEYEPEKSPPGISGGRRLPVPRDFFNDIQKLFAVRGRIWAVTSTLDPKKGALVDVFSPTGEYLDNFFLPLPKGIGLHGLGKLPLTILNRTIWTVEIPEDGQSEIVKYEILEPQGSRPCQEPLIPRPYLWLDQMEERFILGILDHSYSPARDVT
jgi:hypothetical protein